MTMVLRSMEIDWVSYLRLEDSADYLLRHRLEYLIVGTTLRVEERVETEQAVWRYLVRLPADAPLLQTSNFKFFVRMKHGSQI